MSPRWLLLGALAALRCAQGEPIPPGALDLAPASAAAQQALASCERVFSPVAELTAAAVFAATRWSAATGCDVHVGDGGLPILNVPGLTDEATGELVRGMRYADHLAIAAELSIPDRDTAVAHEMGHALAGRHGHAADGLMMARAPTGARITESTLEFVCSELPCTAFKPEDQ